MPIKNLRLHLVAITIICLVIIAIYSLMPHQAGDGGVTGDRYIQIERADWGMNCNPYIDSALTKWLADPKHDTATKPHPANPNNALLVLSNLCNGKMTCIFNADVHTLGDDPLVSCPKRLAVRYRCYSFEPFISKEFGHNNEVTIDCTPHETPNAQAPANSAPAH